MSVPVKVVSLVCPLCLKDLAEGETRVSCPSCGRRFEKDALGIPDLRFTRPGEEDARRRWGDMMESFISWRDDYLRKKEAGRGRLSASGREFDDPDIRTQRRLVEFAGEYGKVVEVGCGPGSLHELADWAGYVGVDPVVYFDRPPPFFFVRAFGERLPFPDGSFDAVYMAASFDYLFRPETALDTFRRVLRPGGLLGICLGTHPPGTPATVQFARYTKESLLELIGSRFEVEYEMDGDYIYLKGTRR